MRDAKPEQLFGFAGTLLILNGFIGIGSGASGTTPAQKRRVSAAYTKFPAHGSLEKFFIKKNNNMLNS